MQSSNIAVTRKPDPSRLVFECKYSSTPDETSSEVRVNISGDMSSCFATVQICTSLFIDISRVTDRTRSRICEVCLEKRVVAKGVMECKQLFIDVVW